MSKCWTELFHGVGRKNDFFQATPHNEAKILFKRRCTSMEYISYKKKAIEDREHGEK